VSIFGRDASPEQMAQLLELLRTGSPEQITGFLESNALASVALMLINAMSPSVRLGFVLALRQEHPEVFGMGAAGEAPS
jgi:hypothetical protein